MPLLIESAQLRRAVGEGAPLEEMGQFEEKQELLRRRRMRLWAGVGLGVLLCDCACAVVLFLSLHDWGRDGGWEGRAHYSWRRFCKELQDFSGDSVDILVACLLRCLLLPLNAFVAVRVGSYRSPPKPRRRNTRLKRRPPPQNNGNGVGTEDQTQPLLGDDNEVLEVTPLKGSAVDFEAGRNSEQDRYRSGAVMQMRRDLALAVLFALCTSFSVFTGIKVVSFHFGSHIRLEGPLMGVAVFWIILVGTYNPDGCHPLSPHYSFATATVLHARFCRRIWR